MLTSPVGGIFHTGRTQGDKSNDRRLRSRALGGGHDRAAPRHGARTGRVNSVTGLTVLISTLINAVIIGLIARRLIAVPVGWPRTILLALIVNAVAAPVSA
mgnify:CR=1 FL=1